jgi:predicted house-cleaning noncanonical NTP pyrophosphatase (MazG superfamily)
MTGKLVRDKIPDIIRAKGQRPVTYTASAGEYRSLLLDKLAEETREVLEADDTHKPEELADVLEVVFALAADMGMSAGDIDEVRTAKADQRGVFAEHIVWTGNEPEHESELDL